MPARVICFATQLSKMRLSIRGEKWIASLRTAETEERREKKKIISRIRIYSGASWIPADRICTTDTIVENVAQCRSRKIAEEVYNRYFKSRPLLLDVYWTRLPRSYVRGETEGSPLWFEIRKSLNTFPVARGWNWSSAKLYLFASILSGGAKVPKRIRASLMQY